MHTLGSIPSPLSFIQSSNSLAYQCPTSNLPYLRTRHLQRARCEPEGEGSMRSLVSEQVDALLQKEENRHLLQGLQQASLRVEDARRALSDIERQEEQAARAKELVLQLQRREAQIAESQKELLAAKTMVEEAERSLSSIFTQLSIDENAKGGEVTDQDLERLESVKAGAVSSVFGVLTSLPISLYQTGSYTQLIQHLAVTFLSSALFGVTFRYAVRRDLDNIQLKTGTAAAFGFVQGLATLEAAKPLEFNSTNFISHIFDGAMYVSTSVLVFLFSAIALDFCFKTSLLSPFPLRK